MKPPLRHLLLLAAAAPAFAAELNVSADKGEDSAPGTSAKPFKTISAAAQKAMPGDTITVHAGVYREWVSPPRGGTSNTQRITYQAAKGEKVTITGSDHFTGWVKVSGDTWKLVEPNSYFGGFNPYAEKVSGDWFRDQGRAHHRGNVYLNGAWLAEAPNIEAVMQPASANPVWFATVDGVVESGPEYLMNLSALKVGAAATIPASKAAERNAPAFRQRSIGSA